MSAAAGRAPLSFLRGRGLRRFLRPAPWRLWTGLVLFAFALTHFLNHALGLVSLQAMEAMQEVRSGLWRSAPGTVLLYGSLAVHAGLGIAATLTRRSWRLPPWQLLQIGLGFAIPVLGVVHVASTRGLDVLVGQDDSYRFVLDRIWPGGALWQTAFLLAVWVHGCIGLRIWLREKRWYPRLAPVLFAAAVLVPALATTGWIEASRRLPLTGVVTTQPDPPPSAAMVPEIAAQRTWIALAALILVLLALRLRDRLRSGVVVAYGDGRTARVRQGATLLETSLAAGIPHAAACGGRGRCTTCRVAVLEGAETLPEPNTTEAAALARIHAPPGVRLACQVRPTASLTVRQLVPAGDAVPYTVADPARWGVERRITVLFADLRGFTSLAERLYAYDSVFLLNRYFELMGTAVERHGGIVDKFLGDGIMALFGMEQSRDAGAGDALRAAGAMEAALATLNEEFAETLRQPLRMGIGIHTGPAVLGRIGGREARAAEPSLTALGDSVNIASRLEALNKEFGSLLVVSEATLDAAGLAVEGAETREVPVRGRREVLRVAVAGVVRLGGDGRLTAPAASA